ncbi:hypothetical protein FAI40_04510 [Acetobacteraceae bacterium]|nr:hypothetical protein FAI40_04510 [Acetobacteraceae bacterium]
MGEIRLSSSLEEHEAAGGHMLRHHSPRSPEKLRERFHEPKPPRASSCFSSTQLMKETIDKALKDNEKTIRQWLLNPKGKERLKLEVKMHKKNWH